MLVISRRQNESIVIADEIEVVVVAIRGDTVRLGVIVPSGTPVCRKEVFDAILSDRRDPPESAPSPAAAGSCPTAVASRPVRVDVAPRHAELLDRLAAGLRQRTGKSVAREQVLEALLDALEGVEAPPGDADDPAGLASRLLKASGLSCD
jgi:carbon storage regulator